MAPVVRIGSELPALVPRDGMGRHSATIVFLLTPPGLAPSTALRAKVRAARERADVSRFTGTSSVFGDRYRVAKSGN